MWAAFAFLTSLIASHAILETARDALFLSRLPATHLPFVYIAIAVLSLAVSRIERRLSRGVSHQTALVGWSLASSLGTLVCGWTLLAGGPAPSSHGPIGLYVLYVWSGIVVALTSVHLWAVLGEAFSITRAKRLFPLVGAGSAVGALVGSGLASGLARVLSAGQLLLGATGGFFLSAGAAVVLAAVSPSAGSRPAVAAADDAWMRDAGLLTRQSYLRRLAAFSIVSAAALTFVDFLFKSTVAANIPASELTVFFGTVALALSALSLLFQVAVVPRLLNKVELGVALALLPIGIAVGGAGLVLGLGLGAALTAKGTDGALRYSLHRTATELLYLPLADEVRPRVRATLDVLGQRGGQALASVSILVMASADVSLSAMSAGFVAVAALWAVTAFGLRHPYVQLLRNNLRGGATLRASAFPELDVASLETLVTALDSDNDAEVLAAMSVLEREGRSRLVPTLLLQHSSIEVVERTLRLFVRTRRTTAIAAIDRLLEHPSVSVRCAAVAARALLAPDARLLYGRLSAEEAPEVRATIVVHLVVAGEIVGQEARERLDGLLSRGTVSTKTALARAIGSREHHALHDVVIALASAPEPEVRVAAVDAMTEHRSPKYLPALVLAIGGERTRVAARTALVQYGDDGFAAVSDAFADASLPDATRWELPRVVAAFEPTRAVATLLDQLGRETPSILRDRIVRALEMLVATHPSVVVDRAALDPVINETLGAAFQRIDQRLVLDRGAAEDPRRKTPGHDLLHDVLGDSQAGLRDRLLRLLGLAHPDVDFARIRRGLRSTSAKTRASSVELATSVVDMRLRAAVVALLDEMPAAERLRASGGYYAPTSASYEDLLAEMLEREGPSLQDIAAFHAAELQIARFRPILRSLADREPTRGDIARALARLTPKNEEVAATC
ncbi:MAG: hypothetical protein HOW73_33870 [Polyangiaceae bacterium]|nr:hypothetical protein [Polyangiaceae bacterium]